MKNIKTCLFIIVSFLLVTGNAFAIPTTLYDITGINGTQKYTDTGAEAFALTDTDGYQDDATAYILLELAGFADSNTFGIYSFIADAFGNVTVTNKLQIFAGTDSKYDSTTLKFQNGMVTNTGSGESIAINKANFGFYISTPQNQTYYTQTALNKDGIDHMMVFDTSDNTCGKLLGSDVVIAIEDLFGGGDKDYNDMVIGISDVQPVPEPATMFLLGSGILGLAGLRRKKAK